MNLVPGSLIFKCESSCEVFPSEHKAQTVVCNFAQMKKSIYFLIIISLLSCQSKNTNNFDENFVTQLENELLKNSKVQNNIHPIKLIMDFNDDGVYDGYNEKEDYFNYINTQEVVDILKSYGAILKYDKKNIDKLKKLDFDYIKYFKDDYLNIDTENIESHIFYLSEIITDDYGENFYFLKFKTNKDEYGYMVYFTDKKMLKVEYYE